MSDEATIVTLEDWAVLYVNGQRVAENHSVPAWELARIMDGRAFTLRVVSASDAADERVSDMGQTPDTLDGWAAIGGLNG